MTAREKHRQAANNFKRLCGPASFRRNLGKKRRRILYWFGVGAKNFGIMALKIHVRLRLPRMTQVPSSIRLRDIKKGREFIEVCGSHGIKAVALEDAHETRSETRNGWECRANVFGGPMDGEEITYFEAFEPGAYGLRLFAYPP